MNSRSGLPEPFKNSVVETKGALTMIASSVKKRKHRSRLTLMTATELADKPFAGPMLQASVDPIAELSFQQSLGPMTGDGTGRCTAGRC